MQESPLKSRFGIAGPPELDPLLRLVETEAGRAPGIALTQLERLVGASLASGKVEQARLARRYGGGDPRVTRAGEKTRTMSVLLDLIGDLKSGLDMKTEAMTVRGFLQVKGQFADINFSPAGKTVEIVDKTYDVVHARTITDGRGRFEMTLAPPEKRSDELIPIAYDEHDKIVARGENFTFEAGQTLNLTLFTSPKAGDDRDRLWRAEERKREQAAEAVRKKAADAEAAPAAKPAAPAARAATVKATGDKATAPRKTAAKPRPKTPKS